MIETGKGKVTFLKLRLRKVGRHSGEDSKQLLALDFFFFETISYSQDWPQTLCCQGYP